MKRDIDLIRYLLLTIESSNKDRVYSEDLMNEQYGIKEVNYHLSLLADSDYIVYDNIYVTGSLIPFFIIYRLTSNGHDYLDSVRDDKIYAATKNKLGEFVKSASLAIIQGTAEAVIKAQLNI